MFELNGKVAIVTGAGQGIGREIALQLAASGAKVALIDVSDKIFDVLEEIKGRGGDGLAIKCDVSSWDDAHKAVGQVLEKYGRIDILVNNAGIAPFKPLAVMSEQDWDKVLDINLKGVFNFTRAVLPKMIEQRYGKIISISSAIGSVVGFPNAAHYAASKAGIAGFTRALALEVAQYGINVNSIAPGPIETPALQSLGKEALEQLKHAIPLGRLGKPEDVANLVLFLASDKSSFITGQNIIIDGGYTLP
ncbi:MAG: 3-oxoacyl-ACP reductase FabG [Aigarchaeota archaeon]|nr:3-oxoacyl-ACP reductase FabG [Candidatus Wolframiiraptor gerlachensis]